MLVNFAFLSGFEIYQFAFVTAHGFYCYNESGRNVICEMSIEKFIKQLHFRLNRMNGMQTIVTGNRGVCLSVSMSVTWLSSASLCKNG